MKVLMDENLDHRLRTHLTGHEVVTVKYRGWTGIKNGVLLTAAEEDGFEVLLTGDQSLYKEQNLLGRRLAIVVLSSVEWHIVKHHLPTILDAIERAVPGSYQEVECGVFDRKK